MQSSRTLVLAFVAAALVACGGGAGTVPVAPGGASGGGAGSGGGGAAPPPAAVPQENHVVVRYDENGDTHPDVVTLDAEQTPFTIVAVLEGTPDGSAVDTTDLRKGQAIDAAISDALAAYLANSFEVASETELDVADSAGNPVRVTVFE